MSRRSGRLGTDTARAYRPGAGSGSDEYDSGGAGGEGLSDDEIANPSAAGRRGSKNKGKGRAVDDDDFIDDEDDVEGGGRGKGTRKGKNDENYAWEASYKRSWDAVHEDESGGLEAAVQGLLVRGRRRRQAANAAASLRRSIIRHLYIILDLSTSMLEKDLRPNRFDLSLLYIRSFVTEWFDQNPLGQIGVIGLRNGLAEMIIEMGGNPHAILAALQDKHKFTPSGEPSLQNGLDMARGSMAHLPSTSSLEVLVLFSSLTTTDPGSISKTLSALVTSRVRVSIIALAAELKICRTITERTGGRFGVALNEQHYRELVFEAVQAPATTAAGGVAALGIRSALDRAQRAQEGRGKPPPCDLMMMGFPTRLPARGARSLCACHGRLTQGGYLCPRCGSKVCEVPTDCEICGLMVVSSPHLARSYWFLFPVAIYDIVPPEQFAVKDELACHGCAVPFPDATAIDVGVSHVEDGVSPTGRYRCQKCKHDFCMECDLFVHDVLHSCPGCA